MDREDREGRVWVQEAAGRGQRGWQCHWGAGAENEWWGPVLPLTLEPVGSGHSSGEGNRLYLSTLAAGRDSGQVGVDAPAPGPRKLPPWETAPVATGTPAITVTGGCHRSPARLLWGEVGEQGDSHVNTDAQGGTAQTLCPQPPCLA